MDISDNRPPQMQETKRFRCYVNADFVDNDGDTHYVFEILPFEGKEMVIRKLYELYPGLTLVRYEIGLSANIGHLARRSPCYKCAR